MAKRTFDVVNLIDLELCLECRFSELVEVERANGTTSNMILCKRGDCDNWDTRPQDSSETVRINTDN